MSVTFAALLALTAIPTTGCVVLLYAAFRHMREADKKIAEARRLAAEVADVVERRRHSADTVPSSALNAGHAGMMTSSAPSPERADRRTNVAFINLKQQPRPEPVDDVRAAVVDTAIIAGAAAAIAYAVSDDTPSNFGGDSE